MQFRELNKLTPVQQAEENSDDEENFVEDKDRFCSQDSQFEGRESPIFDKCFGAFQKNMPNTREEIYDSLRSRERARERSTTSTANWQIAKGSLPV